MEYNSDSFPADATEIFILQMLAKNLLFYGFSTFINSWTAVKGPGAVFRTYGIVTICLSLTSVAMCKSTPPRLLRCIAFVLDTLSIQHPVKMERRPNGFIPFLLLQSFLPHLPHEYRHQACKALWYDIAPTNKPISSSDIFGKLLRKRLSEQKWLAVIGAVRCPDRVVSEGTS